MTVLDELAAVDHDPASPPGARALGDGRGVESYRATARVVGVLYLAGMVLGIAGNVLIQRVLTDPTGLSAIATSGTVLAVGAVLWLTTVVGDAAHGVLMFPVLARRSGCAAVGYVSARIMDAVLIAVMALLIVMQIPLGRAYVGGSAADVAGLPSVSGVLTEANLYAYDFAMTTVSVAGLILCAAFYRSRLVPRPLALWGLVGYLVLLAGSVLQILGLDLHSLHAVPGGLWELAIGVWLIVKGFSSPGRQQA